MVSSLLQQNPQEKHVLHASFDQSKLLKSILFHNVTADSCKATNEIR